MKYKLVEQRAHGDTALYKVWDNTDEVILHVDFITGRIVVSEAENWSIQDRISGVNKEEHPWIYKAKEYLNGEILK